MKYFFLMTLYLFCNSYLLSQDGVTSSDSISLSFLDEKTKQSINATEDTFLQWYKRFQNEAKKQKELIFQANAHRYKAFYYKKNAKRDSAYFYFLKALKLSEKLNDSLQIAKNLLSLGILSKNIGTYKKAESFTFEALQFISKNDYRLEASAYNNLGLIYDNLQQYDEALNFHNKAIKIREEHLSDNLVVASLNNLGKTYKDKKNYASAIVYFERALEFKDVMGRKAFLKAMLMDNLAHTQFLNGAKNNVLSKLKEALEIRKEIGSKDGEIISYLHLAEYYFKIGNKSSALIYAQLAESTAGEISNYRDLLESIDLLVNVQPADSAIVYHNKYVKIRDSLALEEQREQREFDKIEYLVSQANQELVENKEKLKWNTSALYAVLVLLGIAVLAICGFFMIKKRKQQELKESFKEGFENYLRTKYNLTPENIDFWLVYIQGKDQYEMADELCISVDGVKSRRKSLRNKINKVEKIEGNFNKAYAINLYNQEKELYQSTV